MTKPKSKSESIHYGNYIETKKYFINNHNREGSFEKEQYTRARRRQAKEEISEQVMAKFEESLNDFDELYKELS